MCIKKVHFILYFFDALPDMLFMLEFISLSFSVLHRFTSINIVQGVKSCSWIFLYGEIVVTLHCHRKSPPSHRSVPPPFQVRFKSVPYIEDICLTIGSLQDSSAGYWAITGIYIQTSTNIIFNTCEVCWALRKLKQFGIANMESQKGCPIQTPLGGEKNHSGGAIHDLRSKTRRWW